MMSDQTLCILGCGNLGRAILSSLLASRRDGPDALPFTKYIACVRSEESQAGLQQQFSAHLDRLEIVKGDFIPAVTKSTTIILGVDPADINKVLTEPRLAESLENKLLISLVAGLSRQDIQTTIYGARSSRCCHVLRTLPNIGALVSAGLTALEETDPPLPLQHVRLAEQIFSTVGRAIHIPPRLMDASTAVAGSTPAFFAIICDAMIDASVAVGMPRDKAAEMIFQSMRGTAELLQSGIHPGLLRDQGTSPEGCTIAGVMVMEENGVRGGVGKAIREAVSVARLMGKGEEHVNDTRRR